MKPARVFLAAAEPSGDLLGREVAEALKARAPAIELAAIGGSELASIGLPSQIDTSGLAVLGFLEGLKAYNRVVKLADEAADKIVAWKPDAVVLIDSWGFMLRLAQRLRARAPQIRLIKLVGPQVWATRAGRAKTLAATVDHLLCIHDMEVGYYKPHGLKTTVIGNPALSRIERKDGAAWRAQHALTSSDAVILVLPGSRPSELRRVAPSLIAAARTLKQRDPARQIVIAPARDIEALFATQFPDVTSWARVETDASQRYAAMAGASLALACSGTVTSELAVQGTPMIVAYKTGWITWAVARGLLYRRTHISLINIASDDQAIVPEFVQTRQHASLITAQAEAWLTEVGALGAQRARQDAALQRMRLSDRPSAVIAADVILDDLALV